MTQFSDATPNTQSRYSNVTTQGNAVWDRKSPIKSLHSSVYRQMLAAQIRSSPSSSPIPRYDDMPAFSTLQTDDERERKAETQRPGTFGVVVTPESFSDLPEYATATSPGSRRMSLQSLQSPQSQGSVAARTSSLSRTSTRRDPNTVVLDRFEDVSPGAGNPFALPPPDRRPSLPISMHYLTITTTPSAPAPAQTMSAPPLGPHSAHPGQSLIERFRYYIIQRLCQPMLPGISTGRATISTAEETFEVEAARFGPVGNVPRDMPHQELTSVAVTSCHMRHQLFESCVWQREHARSRHWALSIRFVCRYSTDRSRVGRRLLATLSPPCLRHLHAHER